MVCNFNICKRQLKWWKIQATRYCVGSFWIRDIITFVYLWNSALVRHRSSMFSLLCCLVLSLSSCELSRKLAREQGLCVSSRGMWLFDVNRSIFFLQFFSSDACSGFERQGRRTRWLASHSRWNTGMLINCYRNRVFFFKIWQRISDNFCLASVELFSRFKRLHQRALANRNKAVIFSTNQEMLVTHFSRAYHL